MGDPANPDRVVYMNNCTFDLLGDGVAGHGNLNAGIVGGFNNLNGFPYRDDNGYSFGLGVSPYTRLASTKIFANSGFYDIAACGNTDEGVIGASYAMGATFTTNSWGAPVGGRYDVSAQIYDAFTRDAAPLTVGNQEMLHIFAAGNDGPSQGSIRSPGTAKNVLTVGASENVRDNGIADGCNTVDSNNANDMTDFSSRGPTTDGRTKPEIVAPGAHIQGPSSQPEFSGGGVCGAASNNFGSPGDDALYPAGQTLYTWSSGTSHATPAVAGAASLVYEYYGRVLNPGQLPSPAMLKALLLNSPRYMAGEFTNDTLAQCEPGLGPHRHGGTL
ncbi:MAG: S8 family serine peptidase [Chloroflexaceae bacterium]|nr:S8 family serine peptidase [Chloroflexaceae bacterium]